METILKLILRDRVTGDEYQSPEHNNSKKKDDFHREVKPEIIKRIGKKIKEKYGKNGDIEIEDGKIIYVSQKTDNLTGKRPKHRENTGIIADDYFDKIEFIILWSFYEVMNELELDFTITINHTEGRLKEINITIND